MKPFLPRRSRLGPNGPGHLALLLRPGGSGSGHPSAPILFMQVAAGSFQERIFACCSSPVQRFPWDGCFQLARVVRAGLGCRAGLQGWLSCSRGASWCGRHVQAQLSSAQLHAAAFWAVTSRTLWFTVSRESVLSSTHHWTPTAVIQDKLQLHLCRAVVRWKHRSLRAHGRKQS